MSQPYDVEIAKGRIRQVFRYLQEMHRVRTPPVVTLDARPWALPLDSLDPSSYLHKEFETDAHGGAPRGQGEHWREFVLKVSRPQGTGCPEPSVVLKNWLRSGWDVAGADPEIFVKKMRKHRGGSKDFDDLEERVRALEEWLDRKTQWESDERDILDARSVFSELFEIHAAFERESEKYQLFLGDGILVMEHNGERVAHPVLLQRVQLVFNPTVPGFTVVDTDDNPEIYSPLLRHLEFDGKSIQQVTDALAAEHFHPLAGDSTSGFLRDFVQGNWKDGKFLENADEFVHADGPCLYRKPYLFLGSRNQGLVENIDRYLESLDGQTELPESLLRIVGIETGRGAGEEARPTELLMTKHANPEQERVIRQLEDTGAVLVQGPPGTGKSHTIANLIGHLLAQDKSILVTSHASKALKVVREKLAKPLQPLCVSLLQGGADSGKQLEESITGIVNYLATTSEKKLERDLQEITGKRAALKAKFDELHVKILGAAQGEYQEIEVMGERVAPSDAARRLVQEAGVHDWISGAIDEAELPLSTEEVDELYALTAELSAEDDEVLSSRLPDFSSFPTPQEFSALYDEIASLERQDLKADRNLWEHDDQTGESLSELREVLGAAVELLADPAEWVLECVEAGRAGGERSASWTEIVAQIERCACEVAEKEPLVLQHGPRIDSDRPDAELIRICEAILQHLDSGKRLGKVSTLLRPEWTGFLKAAEVDEGTPSKKEHFRALLHLLQIRAARDALVHRWERQMTPLGAPSPSELGVRPEVTARESADRITQALGWHAEEWARCEQAIDRAGLDWARFSKRARQQPAVHAESRRIVDLVNEHLEPVLATRAQYLRWKSLTDSHADWQKHLDSYSRREKAYAIIKLLKAGLKKGNYDTYFEGWSRLRDLGEARGGFERRHELLARLESVAPDWAAAIRERREPHAAGKPPGDVVRAWRNGQWEQRLTARSKIDLDKLQARLQAVKEDLFETTAVYVEKLAWRAQLRRTGLAQQQALNGWLAIHKKIGRGTGKNVARLKEDAKRTLEECRSAVPVWIMPMSRIAESFDLATTRFDVIILDEASQSDVMGLVAFALAKEVVVVGDHEQVSPYAVGQKGEKINALITELLTDIPNKRLYDGKTSVYDLARQSFGATIRLLEHFRCVPDIIQFSNYLCYGGEIRALRDASAGRLRQPLVAHRVETGEEVNGVNEVEALEIVSLVSAICKLDEYEGCTIGVICMVGSTQALYIDSVLRRRLTVAEYQRRQILCGNAPQFQGDERDIIFLSMVNSPSDKPLTLRQRDDTKKAFNVAASRARDQLWVVHSLDPARDLKPGDLRLELISHAANPDALRPEVSREKTRNTEFEQHIHRALVDAHYAVTPHWEVGNSVIDLVVQDGAGRRIAVQCDGDRIEAAEVVAEDLQRQSTLERLGWDFIRLQASAYFRHPERVVKRLFKRLQDAGIQPDDRVGEAAPAEKGGAHDELTARVLRRAEIIRQRWKDIPTVSVVQPASRAGDPAPPDPDSND